MVERRGVERGGRGGEGAGGGGESKDAGNMRGCGGGGWFKKVSMILVELMELSFMHYIIIERSIKKTDILNPS